MKKFLISGLAAALAFGAASANAATFVFKGDGGLQDVPTGNIAFDCGSVGADYCTANDAAGFTYSKEGITFTAKGYANNVAAQLVQDIFPNNSGLAVLSEGDGQQDQTQFDSKEAIEFVFTQAVTLFNIEFNAGNDTDCSTPGSEGPCGNFDLYIDNVLAGNFVAIDLLAGNFLGTSFRFVPTTAAAGFAIAQFQVTAANVVPIPGALPLLLSGLAGLGFASRRKKTA